MSNSPRWSNALASCRLEWRPSRWLTGLLVSLGVLAALSLLAADLPRMLAWPGALIALAYAAWLTRREALRPGVELCISGGVARINGEPVEGFHLHWRGSLVFMRWRTPGGPTSKHRTPRQRIQRLVWWPDTLSRTQRRELRLAAPAETRALASRSVAP